VLNLKLASYEFILISLYVLTRTFSSLLGLPILFQLKKLMIVYNYEH
jgi:hypothetical protein